MEQGRAGMYPPYYAPAPNYVVHRQSAPSAPPALVRDGYGNPVPYVYADPVIHDPNCRYGYDERRRRNGIANALAAAFIVCWCCTWPCHGPCCCGM